MGVTPQLEDGYTRIANDLLDAIIKFDFSKRQQKIVFAVARKTYGFGKKNDDISASQLVEITGLSRANVSRTIAELKKRNVLTVDVGKYGYLIEINKNYLLWG